MVIRQNEHRNKIHNLESLRVRLVMLQAAIRDELASSCPVDTHSVDVEAKPQLTGNVEIHAHVTYDHNGLDYKTVLEATNRKLRDFFPGGYVTENNSDDGVKTGRFKYVSLFYQPEVKSYVTLK